MTYSSRTVTEQEKTLQARVNELEEENARLRSCLPTPVSDKPAAEVTFAHLQEFDAPIVYTGCDEGVTAMFPANDQNPPVVDLDMTRAPDVSDPDYIEIPNGADQF